MFNIKPLLVSVAITSLVASIFTFDVIAKGQNDKNELPDIGISGFSVLSLDKERQIGKAMMRQLRASQPIIQDPVLIEYINHLGNQLVKNAHDVNYAFEFFLINNNELNAFAFFGGHVGIHSGLLTTADNESELASVIAHEISHVTQRHLARRLESQSSTQALSMAGMVSGILIALVNPAVGMAALSASMAASQQASINYTRGNEQEADRVGIALLAASDFDPQGAPSFFGKMSEKYRYASKPPAMLLTHPLPESRISDARQRAHKYPIRNLAPSLNFELAKARIQARYQSDAKSNIAFFDLQLRQKTYSLQAGAQYGLALSYFENGDFKQAKKILESLKSSDKNNLFYIDALTDVYLALKEFDSATESELISVLKKHTTEDYHWRGMHPFYEQYGAEAVIETFWKPLKKSFSPIQRREDMFFAGANDCDDGKTQWVVNVGNLLGLFDNDWLGIPSTGKMIFLRYAEFHRVEGDKIAETAFFCDILSVMDQAIGGHRDDISQFAPRIHTMKVSVDKIRDIIGKGGATIRQLTEETGTTIEIEDDGTVKIAATDGEQAKDAIARITALTAEIEVGTIYTGKVVRIVDFGAFVNVLPGKDGLVHISQISEERVNAVTDVLSEGQEVTVKVLEVDRQGRVRLSIKEAMEKPAETAAPEASEEAPAAE